MVQSADTESATRVGPTNYTCPGAGNLSAHCKYSSTHRKPDSLEELGASLHQSQNLHKLLSRVMETWIWPRRDRVELHFERDVDEFRQVGVADRQILVRNMSYDELQQRRHGLGMLHSGITSPPRPV
jgi:hypothetical protein